MIGGNGPVFLYPEKCSSKPHLIINNYYFYYGFYFFGIFENPDMNNLIAYRIISINTLSNREIFNLMSLYIILLTNNRLGAPSYSILNATLCISSVIHSFTLNGGLHIFHNFSPVHLFSACECLNIQEAVKKD